MLSARIIFQRDWLTTRGLHSKSNIQFKVNKVKIQIPDVYFEWSQTTPLKNYARATLGSFCSFFLVGFLSFFGQFFVVFCRFLVVFGRFFNRFFVVFLIGFWSFFYCLFGRFFQGLFKDLLLYIVAFLRSHSFTLFFCKDRRGRYQTSQFSIF